MDASHLPPQKARDIATHVAPTLDFLGKLTARMEALGWKPTDPGYLAAVRARDAVREMTGALLDPQPQQRRPWEPSGSGRDGFR